MNLKKIIPGCFFLFTSFTALAQFAKGDKMVGASLASFFFNAGGSDVSFPQVRGYSGHSRAWGVSIEPSIGWFISPKTAIGGTIHIKPTGTKTWYEDSGTAFQEDKENKFHIGIGSFIRHYFSDNSSSFMPFGQFGFNTGINSASSEGFKYYDSNPDYKVSYDGKSSGGFFANATAQVGMSKMMGRNVSLDVFVGYNYSYNKNTYKTTTSTDLDLNGTIDFKSENEPTTKFTSHGVILGVGFQVFLRKS